MLQKVVFLDRDGVINRDSPNYIKSWAEFEFLPGSIEAIKTLTNNGFTTIIISNQSAINRNLMPMEELDYIHRMMKKAVKSQGGEIKDIFFCPHTPEEGCECRKPKPGLIFMAQKTYEIDILNSILVGDTVKDIECAHKAGCGYTVLVKTGNGIKSEKILEKKKILLDHVAENLYEAARWILSCDKKIDSRFTNSRESGLFL